MFTFKAHHPTGRYRSFGQRTDDIKIKQDIVGSIGSSVNDRQIIKVRFMIIDETEHAGWRWITLAKKFESFDDARTYCKTNYKAIIKQLNLHHSKQYV